MKFYLDSWDTPQENFRENGFPDWDSDFSPNSFEHLFACLTPLSQNTPPLVQGPPPSPLGYGQPNKEQESDTTEGQSQLSNVVISLPAQIKEAIGQWVQLHSEQILNGKGYRRNMHRDWTENLIDLLRNQQNLNVDLLVNKFEKKYALRDGKVTQFSYNMDHFQELLLMFLSASSEQVTFSALNTMLVYYDNFKQRDQIIPSKRSRRERSSAEDQEQKFAFYGLHLRKFMLNMTKTKGVITFV